MLKEILPSLKLLRAASCDGYNAGEQTPERCCWKGERGTQSAWYFSMSIVRDHEWFQNLTWWKDESFRSSFRRLPRMVDGGMNHPRDLFAAHPRRLFPLNTSLLLSGFCGKKESCAPALASRRDLNFRLLQYFQFTVEPEHLSPSCGSRLAADDGALESDARPGHHT